MVRSSLPEKVHGRHRDRLAIVYIRQSTLQQVERNQESTRLQYALVDRAFMLGWPREAIIVVDDDLGRSGATIEGRLGFQRLVAEVGLGHVGLVLGIEMSRLARSCRYWHQLLEICSLFDTLIADADGVYDAGNFNDRLLLGLKGTMSEAELHVIKARMMEGRLAKARRGELAKAVPMGYVQRPSGEVIFDPDEQAQSVIRLVFDLFDRLRTVGAVLVYLIEHDVKMPVRRRHGPTRGDLEWHRPSRPGLYDMFSNPIYAGIYTWGRRQVDRRRQRPGRPGTGRRSRGPENVEVFLPDRLPAYISRDKFEQIQAQIRSNRTNDKGHARAGSALLSGMVTCGVCGLRMTSSYNNNGKTARYMCAGRTINYADPLCQSLPAAPVDAEVTRLVLQALEPAAMDISLAVANDLEAERNALDKQWHQRLERAQHDVDRARHQYTCVDPENRLVARTLEKDWETALAAQARLAVDYDRFKRERMQAPSGAELIAVRKLTDDLPNLWHATTTTQKERQEITRLLLERVLVKTIDDTEHAILECHWQGGNQTVHRIVRPVKRATDMEGYSALIARLRELHQAGNHATRIADILNEEGWRPPKRRDTYNAGMVHQRLLSAGITAVKFKKPLCLADRGPHEWTVGELAKHIGMPESTLYTWVQNGRLSCRSITVAGKIIKLLTADAETIESIRAIRSIPPHLRKTLPSNERISFNFKS
ncbi:recombinase family protein [Novosphingobium sp. Fuku2-ISO-50]|uniref:recombinase family protein n=1 Tax=Novosphingobium sp. Fuku2-ISO-50 TaxID=1739114 RepID=UPI0018D208AE|nr:recombinase family protein [Novosphingobium sp. Fuku2-ISO-50]